MNEPWLSFQEAVAAIRRRLKTSIGRSEALLRAACSSGDIRSRDERVILSDDGIVSMDQRPGAINKGGVTQDGKLLVHTRLPPDEGWPKFSEDDLLDWLDRQALATKPAEANKPPRGRSGPKARWDWPDIEAFVIQTMDAKGDFDDPKDAVDGWKSQTDLISSVIEYIEGRLGVEAPGSTTLKQRIRPMVDRWRRSSRN